MFREKTAITKWINRNIEKTTKTISGEENGFIQWRPTNVRLVSQNESQNEVEVSKIRRQSKIEYLSQHGHTIPWKLQTYIGPLSMKTINFCTILRNIYLCLPNLYSIV